MDAILLALASAFLFGAMTVALRPALAQGTDPLLGALLTLLPAVAVVAAATVLRGSWTLSGVWPFMLAGTLGPGCSQVLFTYGVRDAGPSRASVTVGTAPLFSVAIALVALGEPLVAGVIAGAVLIVTGGLLLAFERGRPPHVKTVGLIFALGSTVAFAARDNLVRWLSGETEVVPELAAAVTLTSGAVAIALVVLVTRRPLTLRPIAAYALPGLLFGLSYVSLFEAYYRGRVTVVSPLVATESLWGVILSAVFLRRHELVGPKLVAGAVLVVAGGVLIGIFR